MRFRSFALTAQPLALILGFFPFVAATGFLPPSRLYGQELFRTTPTVGAVGDGRLTAQISYEGTVICLRYPNATFYEHIRYAPGYWDPERSRNPWLKPYFGARENEGIFAGIFLYENSLPRVYWLRELKRSFSYASPRSNRLLGTYEAASGLRVEEETFVVPGLPVLIRGYTLQNLPPGATSPALVVVASPALSLKRQPYNPLHQTEEDDLPRFASFYLKAPGAILTALPRTRTVEMENALKTLVLENPVSARVEAFVDEEQGRWGEGIYLLQGGGTEPLEYQVGSDRFLDPRGPLDAYEDARDGFLSLNPLAVSFETTALKLPFERGEAVWYGVFATTVTEALAQLAEVRTRSRPELQAESDRYFEAWSEGLLLPQGERETNFAYRTWISLRTGYDPESGVIVASTSCSPPYNLDWPRDGAFFQLFLIMNGRLEEAERHALFYPKLQYQKGYGLYGPPGAFAMNGYSDGTPGGPVDFEIDEVGFVLWIYEMTAAALAEKDLGRARTFLKAIRTSTYLAAELLTRCQDEATGLQCPANEDDNPEFTQTIHGAITVWMGLRASARIFAALGESSLSERYARRAEELAAAIRRYLDPEKPISVRSDNLDLQAYAWTIWPAYFYAADEARILAYLRRAFIQQLAYVFGPEGRDTIYDTKPGIALLIPPLRTPETVSFMQGILERYLSEVITPGTLHLAEVATRYDLDGDGKLEWVNRVAPPHLWAQTLLYFALIARDDPEKLLPPLLRPELFEAPSPPPGCTCALGREGSLTPVGLALALSFLCLFFLLRRKPAGKNSRNRI